LHAQREGTADRREPMQTPWAVRYRDQAAGGARVATRSDAP
jgi:hypothetical protein